MRRRLGMLFLIAAWAVAAAVAVVLWGREVREYFVYVFSL
jgi:hypothetical protein